MRLLIMITNLTISILCNTNLGGNLLNFACRIWGSICHVFLQRKLFVGNNYRGLKTC